SIRSTLAGDLPMLQRFYTVELKGGAAKWRMKLLPLEDRTRDMVKEIVISGRGDRVTTIEMLEANGDRSTMTVTGEAP
ncbi:MAG: LolA-related protein, partial [Gallionellaceae bacterium]|nr:LolA-related protein [Gallionellaceae bacterium]